jgi:FlaA1/EpsC-like NDP-sugar epimerase
MIRNVLDMLLILSVTILFGLYATIMSFIASELALGLVYMEATAFSTLSYLLVNDWVLGTTMLELLVVYMSCILAVESVVLVSLALRMLVNSDYHCAEPNTTPVLY